MTTKKPKKLPLERGHYRAILTVLIDGPDYQALSSDARLVFLTLKLNLGPSGIDVFYLPVLEPQTGLAPADIERAMTELCDAGWVRRERNVIWIVEGLKYEPSLRLSNANHLPTIQEHLRSLPRLAIVSAFRQHYGLEQPAGADPKPPEPHHGEPDIAPTEDAAKKPRKPKSAEQGAAFEAFWQEYPAPKGNKQEAQKKFNARLKEGVDATHIMARLALYKAFVVATDRKVMNASTFVGPSKRYDDADWDSIPPASDDTMGRLIALRNAQDQAIREGEAIVNARLAS